MSLARQRFDEGDPGEAVMLERSRGSQRGIAMKKDTLVAVNAGRSKTVNFSVALLLLVAGIGVWAPSVIAALGEPGQGDYVLVVTPAAAARTAANDCPEPSTPVCKEICLSTTDGHTIPQNRFVCTGL